MEMTSLTEYRIKPVGEKSYVVERKGCFFWRTFLGDVEIDMVIPYFYDSVNTAKSALIMKLNQQMKERQHKDKPSVYLEM